MSDIHPVSQRAREAAISLLDHNDPKWWAIKTERGDGDRLVQAFAQFEAEVLEGQRMRSFEDPDGDRLWMP